TERLNDLRQPESDAKERQQNAQLRERQKQGRTMKKYGGRAPRRRRPAFAPNLLRQGGGEPDALLGEQPAGVFRSIVKPTQGDHAEHYRRQTLEQKQPLP